MPRISLWKPNRTFDYSFHDNRIREMFTIGGTGVNIHKYMGTFQQDAGDAELIPIVDSFSSASLLPAPLHPVGSKRTEAHSQRVQKEYCDKSALAEVVLQLRGHLRSGRAEARAAALLWGSSPRSSVGCHQGHRANVEKGACGTTMNLFAAKQIACWLAASGPLACL